MRSLPLGRNTATKDFSKSLKELPIVKLNKKTWTDTVPKKITKERRSGMTCKVIEVKIDRSRLSTKALKKIPVERRESTLGEKPTSTFFDTLMKIDGIKVMQVAS